MNKKNLFLLSALIFFILSCSIIGFYFYSSIKIAPNKNESFRNNIMMEDLHGKSYKKVKIIKSENQRLAFLTFDDGPCSNNTLKILNILSQNNIKATFFVVGKQIERYPDIAYAIMKNNMSIMPHSYSHQYSIYSNVEWYKQDLEQCSNAIQNITGEKTGIYVRMPGGSKNRHCDRTTMESIRGVIGDKDMYCVDWNVSGGDAVASMVPSSTIKNNVLSQCEEKKIAVILLHDAYYKNSTVEALPDIIKGLKEMGYRFKTFSDITPEERDRLIKLKVINI